MILPRMKEIEPRVSARTGYIRLYLAFNAVEPAECCRSSCRQVPPAGCWIERSLRAFIYLFLNFDPIVFIPTEINVVTTGGGGRFGEQTLRKLVGSVTSSAPADHVLTGIVTSVYALEILHMFIN